MGVKRILSSIKPARVVTCSIGIRIPEANAQQLAQIAKEKTVSMSVLINAIIDDFIIEYKSMVKNAAFVNDGNGGNLQLEVSGNNSNDLQLEVSGISISPIQPAVPSGSGGSANNPMQPLMLIGDLDGANGSE